MKRAGVLIIVIAVIFSISANAAYIERIVEKSINNNSLDVIIIKENDVKKTSQVNSIIKNKKDLNLINGYAATIKKEDLNLLKEDPSIRSIYLDKKVQLVMPQNDDNVSIQLTTATNAIGANYVWDNLNYTGKNITIAILDTGIDYTHPDLGNCTNITNCSKVTIGHDFVNGDNDPMDDHGHGTHVAGISSANGVLKGVAPDSKLIAVKVLNVNGTGSDSKVISGIEYAIANGADIISMSLGGRYQEYEIADTLRIAVENAAKNGTIFVISAGNSGPGTSTIGSPGDAKWIITVGSYSETLDNIASYSSRGPAPFGRLDPDISAPGSSITSTMFSGAPICGLGCSCGGNYATCSGTSMAAPMISGAVALMLEKNNGLKLIDVKNKLMQTSDNINSLPFYQGAGLVNLSRTFLQNVSALINNTNVWEFDIKENETKQAKITINNSYAHSLNLTFEIEEIYENELLDSIDKNSFDITESIIIPKNTVTNITVNFTLGSNITPFTYATTLIISSNNSDNIRLPIVINRIIDKDITIESELDDDGNNDYPDDNFEGDWIYHKIDAPAGPATFRLLWNSSDDDLDLFIFSENGTFFALSAEGNTDFEIIQLTFLKNIKIWTVFNSYDIAGIRNYTYIVLLNDKPSFQDTINNITIEEDKNISFNVNATDNENDTILYYINNTNANITESGFFSYMPAANWYGITYFNITISDSYINNSIIFFVNVTPVNDAPIINITFSSITINEDEYNDTINLSYYITDIDDNINQLNVSCNSSNNNISVAINNKILNITAQANYFGNSTITCKVNDSEFVYIDFFNAAFVSVNDVPIINLSSLNIIMPWNSYNDTINLSLYVHDADNSISDLTLDCISSNSNISANLKNNMLNITPSYRYYGKVIITCNVSDSQDSSHDSFNVTVYTTNNAPQIINLSNITINAGNQAIINITATDVENDTLYYSINDSRFSAYENRFIWNTSIFEDGFYLVKINVSDLINDTLMELTLNIYADFDGDGNPNYNDTDDDNDGVNDTFDKIIGNMSNINTNVQNVSITINNTANYTQDISGKVNVEIKKSNHTIIKFEHNFSITNLALYNINISENVSLYSKNYIFIKNLEIQYNKTIYLDKTSNYRQVCIKDAQIDNIDEVSSKCNLTDEHILNCNGSVINNYTCNITNQYYEIKGLKHSAIIEYGFCGDGLINNGEECEGPSDFNGQTCVTKGFDSGSLSCNSCIISTTNCRNEITSSGGGSSSSVIKINKDKNNITNTTQIRFNKTMINESIDIEIINMPDIKKINENIASMPTEKDDKNNTRTSEIMILIITLITLVTISLAFIFLTSKKN